MSLFLIFSPLIAYFFLRGTVFSGTSDASLRLYAKGVLASVAAAILFWLTRELLPCPINGILGMFHHWYYGWFLWLALGTGIFVLVPSWMQGPGRADRLTAFLFGTVSLSGLATVLHTGLPRDPYWVIILPLIRIGLIPVLVPLLDELFDETGSRLGLMIAAAVLISLLPSLIPVFHFWKAWYLFWPLLLACLGIGAWKSKDLFLEPLADEYWALRRGE